MKTWLEYINEQAALVALEVKLDSVWRQQGPFAVDWADDGVFLATRAEVEAFVLGVVFGRTGKVSA